MLNKITKVTALDEKINLFKKLFDKNPVLYAKEYEELAAWGEKLAQYGTVEKLETEKDNYYVFHVKKGFTDHFQELYKTNNPARCIRNVVVSEKENFSVCAHGLPVIPSISKFSVNEISASESYYINDKLDGITVEIFKRDGMYFVKNKHSILFISKDLNELNFSKEAKVGERIRAFIDFLNNETGNNNILVFEFCAPLKEWKNQFIYTKETNSCTNNAWLGWLDIAKQPGRGFIPITHYTHYDFCLLNIVNFPYSFYEQHFIDKLSKAFDIPRPVTWTPQRAKIYENTYAQHPRMEGYVLYLHDCEIMAKNTTYAYELKKWMVNQIGSTLEVL
jgi:hypothetical protein